LDRQHILGRHGIRVKLDDVDEAPGPYAMSFGFDLDPLCESIKAIGLVNPPCIGRDEKGRMEVITGYRRLLALKQMGWSEVTCEDLSSSFPSPRERLLFALHENLASRVFNPVEKAMILGRLSALHKKEAILKNYMPLLSLPSHEDTLLFYLGLAERGCEFLQAVAGGRVSLKAARALMAMESNSGDEILHWISEIMLNVNEQMQFIDMLTDVSSIERREITQILNDDVLRRTLLDRRLNNPQKAKRLLDQLRCRRNPRWKAAESRFQERVDRLSLPDGARINHPACFEAPGYRMEVQFRNGAELMQKLRRLGDLPALEEFRDPLFDDD
jgi:hypothetical protein